MKKLISILLLLLIGNLSIAQDNKFIYSQDGLNPKYLVVNVDSTSQSEIYQKSIKWIKTTFKNPDKVILSQIENEMIRIEGFSDNAICFGSGTTASCEGLTYQIEISFKEGRYKIEPLNLSYYISGYGGVDVSLTKGAYWNKKGKLRKLYSKIPNQIEELFNGLNDNLSSFVSDTLKKDGW